MYVYIYIYIYTYPLLYTAGPLARSLQTKNLRIQNSWDFPTTTTTTSYITTTNYITTNKNRISINNDTCKNMIESNPPRSRFLVRGLAVLRGRRMAPR